MEKTDHNAHSVYLMYYHLIMVVKYRRKVINDPISERAKEQKSKRAKEIWEYIAPRYGIVLEEWNHDIDHVHAFWSQSFCLLTAGGAPVEVIRQYIETQGEKKH